MFICTLKANKFFTGGTKLNSFLIFMKRAKNILVDFMEGPEEGVERKDLCAGCTWALKRNKLVVMGIINNFFDLRNFNFANWT